MTVDILVVGNKNDIVDMAMDYMDSLELDIRVLQLEGDLSDGVEDYCEFVRADGTADAIFTTDKKLHEKIRERFPESHIFDILGVDECLSDGAFIGALEDFKCKLRETAFNSERLFRLREYGNLYCGDKISVIVPCYNVEKYVGECIDSLLASDLPSSMIEFIFADDASDDDTVKIINEYKEKYPENIIVIEFKEHVGVSIARNAAIERATGNFIGFLDADDKACGDMYRKLYEKVVLYKCDFSGCDSFIFNDVGCGGEFFKPKENLLTSDTLNERRYQVLEQESYLTVWLHLYKKSFLDENDLRFPEHIYMEDIYFHWMCALCAKRTYVLGEALYWYRQNPKGITKSDKVVDYYMDAFYSVEKAYREAEKRGLIKGVEKEFEFYYYRNAVYQPIMRMASNYCGIQADENNILLIENTTLEHFPNIADNPYINSINEENNKWVVSLLR
jgi:glycosyltransferase involved in cell wall biosynthesis